MTEILNKETGELTQAPDEAQSAPDPETADVSDPVEDAIAAEMTPEPGDAAPPDDETDEPDEPDERTPAPSQSVVTMQEMERALKQMETAALTYTKRVGAVLPPDTLHLELCPLCSPMYLGFVDIEFAGRIPDDIKQATMMYLGYAREQEYEPDPSTEQCSVCKGKGKTSTGSNVPGNDSRRCTNCQGFGYYPPPGSGVGSAPAIEPEHAPVGDPSEIIAVPETDPTGEPRILPDGRENPNYMKWPQAKVLVPPYGVTLGLTAQSGQ
jgi:hypothetical protein